MVERAKLQRGQRILIHAGASGVGTIAIQLAKHRGVPVATTTSAANVDLVRTLGADTVVDCKTQDFTETVSGCDVVLRGLNASILEASLKVLKPGGKLISISGPPDPAFAKARGLNLPLRLIFPLLIARIRRKAKRAGVAYSFCSCMPMANGLASLAACSGRAQSNRSSTAPSPSINSTKPWPWWRVDAGGEKWS